MSKDRDEKFDPAQPTLIVKSGNTARKYRRLEKEVVVLGRAAGCDVGLEAPEVAAVHCVLVRAAEGWRVRDCTGRGGTRVNGRSVQDEALSDADVLQIGSFSFEVHLPPPCSRAPVLAAVADASLQRVRRSRQNLAQLALRLRRRLQKAVLSKTQRAEQLLSDRQEEQDRQAEEMGQLQSDLDARLAELKQTAQEIAVQNAALEERRRRTESELAERQAQTEATLRASVEEYQARRRQLEKAHARTLAEQEWAYLESVGEAPKRLEIRARELGCFAGHLRRFRQRLHDHENNLTARWEEWLRERQQSSVEHAQERQQIAREELILKGQRSEVVRLMGEMRQLRHLQRHPTEPPVESLREDNDRLRLALAESERAAADARKEADRRAAEVDELRALWEAKGGEKGRAGAEAPVPDGAALNRFRVELETSRRSLADQIRLIQGKYTELGRTALDAEAQIGRQRGRIAQEQTELERLREELWPDGPAGGAETLVDTPSPLRHLPEIALRLGAEATRDEAARAPS